MKYFISGHRDLTQEEFNKYYIPKINYVVDSDPFPIFYVCDYWGADTMAQEYLKSLLLSDKILFSNVRVVHMREEAMNYAFEPGTVTKINCRKENNGEYNMFKDDIDRDSWVTENTDFDIAFVRESKVNSGTEQNIIRRAKFNK